MSESPPVVALLVTCLVDLFRPSVATAAVRLLERRGFRVEVPSQTCCGQPNRSGGDDDGARRLARRLIASFAPYARVVAPSASCVATVHDYPALFPPGSDDHAAAVALAARTVELTALLGEQGPDPGRAAVAGPLIAAWHDGCVGLRRLGLDRQPRELLARVAGLELRDLPGREECCGFGGAFCVEYPEISAQAADHKLDEALATGAQLLLGADLGCLLHLQGRAQRRGLPLDTAHIAEVLAAAIADDGHGPEDG